MQAVANSKLPISLVIITRNEESNIQRCIQSAPFVDEVIVMDSGSTDRTCEIAANLGAKVFQQPWLGFGPQKNMAASKAKNDWILSLDADEELSTQLISEISEKFSQLQVDVGYQFPRISQYMGKWIRHGGWYPDSQLRLYNRQHSSWLAAKIHEKVQAQRVEKFNSEIKHYVFADVASHVETNNRYSGLLAEADFDKGKRFNLLRLLVKPPIKFLETYFLKLGFLDGLPGFVIAVGASYSIFLRILKTREVATKRQGR